MSSSRNVTFLKPGYSTLWTKDLKYTPGTGEASDLNPLDPNSERPLVEGEWLELGSTGTKWKRGGNDDAADANEGTVPAGIFWMERGRYDSQVSQLVHCVVGPYGYEVRVRGTGIIDSTGLSVGSKVTVQDLADDDAIVRRGLALHSAGFVIGRITRVFGTNDCSLWVMPA